MTSWRPASCAWLGHKKLSTFEKTHAAKSGVLIHVPTWSLFECGHGSSGSMIHASAFLYF